MRARYRRWADRRRQERARRAYDRLHGRHARPVRHSGRRSGWDSVGEAVADILLFPLRLLGKILKALLDDL